MSDVIDKETDKLLQQVNEGGDFRKRKQVLLKALVCTFMSEPYHPLYHRIKQSFRRDGQSCLLTGKRFRPFHKGGIKPVLAHIIPNTVHGKVYIKILQSPPVSS